MPTDDQSAPSAEHVLCYAAIALPASAAATVAAHVHAQPIGNLRPALPDRYHVTLAYFGSVASPQIDDLAAALAATTAKHRKIHVAIAGGGNFDGRTEVWAGVAGDIVE